MNDEMTWGEAAGMPPRWWLGFALAAIARTAIEIGLIDAWLGLVLGGGGLTFPPALPI